MYALSVIVNMHNMRREAARTLFSLSLAYQRLAEGITYEVIVLDNGSTQPLEPAEVKAFGENFRYVFFDAHSPSPCAAMNHGARLARGNLLMLCIDGARILSPGILRYSMQVCQLYHEPFVYTLAMHIGGKLQNHLVEENYSEADEDRLLEAIDWQRNGYSLFDISSVAASSGQGYLSELRESNCITVSKATYESIGGFEEGFSSPGGGLANLDLFNRLNAADELTPVLLLGEATFHQFHGGVATNVRMQDHPWKQMAAEYKHVRGKDYRAEFKPPVLFGKVHPKTRWLLTGPGEKP